MKSQDIKEVIKSSEQFFKELLTDKNGRYRSWEHCYSAFMQHKGNVLSDEDVDYLCLHLAFYLASWGMYRGSSKLLQKDYKVHTIAVKELMKKEYLNLWAVRCEELQSTSDKLEKLFVLSSELQRIYREFGVTPTVTPTDTLITKILMGTLGCVPAYDRYFIDGVKGKNGAHLAFNKNSIQELSKLYVENNSTFEEWRKSISTDELEYPQMKVLDMCFWRLGYKLEIAQKNK